MNRPHPRIRMLVSGFRADAGGPSTVIRDLARALLAKGVDLTLETAGEGAFAPDLPCVDADDARAFAAHLAASRAQGGREVLHTHGVWEPRLLWRALRTRVPGGPWILSPHGSLAVLGTGARYRTRRLLAKTVMAPLIRRADVLLCTSAMEAAETARVIPHPAIRVLPWGVRLEGEPPPPPAPGAPPVVGFLGRLHPIKRVELLLEAVARLSGEGVDLRLAVGGDGDPAYAAALRARAGALGIAHRVRWEGWIPDGDRARFLGGLAALALVSEFENFGCVVGEAMLASVPVVVAESCPWPVLREKDLGAWVPGTAEGVAAGLRGVLADPGRSGARAARAREWAATELSWDRVADRYLEILDGIP